MEFPELLSVLLYEDCSAHILTEEARLKTLATANGCNSALILYLNYFNKIKQCPNPEQLLSHGFSTPKFSEEQIADDLERAADYRKAFPPGSFAMALEHAWGEANQQYMSHGYTTAHGIAGRHLPKAVDQRQLKKLYGEEQADWDFTAFSQIWLAGYLAANPFTKKEAEEVEAANEHEYVLATGVGVEDDEVVNTTLTAINATDVKPELLRWLWPDRIPQGKICWFAGKPGLGKSLAMLDLIARVTTGAAWPDGTKNSLPPQDVLLAVSEDGLGDTVIPRLNAAGADLARIKFIHRVKVNESQRLLQLSNDTQLLKKALQANPSVTLVGLDPLTSFSGDVNINVDQDIRPIMDALSSLCNKTGVTLVGVIHHNKRSDVDALQKILGASSVAGAARTAWGFSRDPDNQNEFYMSLVKNNLSKRRTGMKYTIGEKTVGDIPAPHIVWGEETDATADDLLNAERDTSGRAQNKQITLAREFLPQALAKGPRLAQELYDEAERAGISSDTLKRAKRELGGITVYRMNNRWTWSNSSDDPIPDDVI
ncbi:MAG: AAA family ATPase [Acidobacteriia bacterium]|nr:AAA family ATPase [Terriglobia bacterium]